MNKSVFKGVKKSWKKIIKNSITEEDFNNLDELLKTKYYPNEENIFETFKYFDVKNTKVVILGQDCYINEIVVDDTIYPQACGLAFSVNKEHKTPPSLKNIYKELSETIEGFTIPDNGDLSRWVKEENVLLLNASLTVKPKTSGSHMKYWKNITDNIIKEISNQTENVVFILWGNFAKSKATLIDMKKHKIISGQHPSPLSANYSLKGTDRSFFGRNYFNKANLYLTSKDIEPVNWEL